MGATRRVMLEWTGEGLAFRGGGTEPVSPSVVIDSDSAAGPSPMHLVLLAAGACSGIDVVMILQKMRVTIDRFTVEAVGERAEDPPRRFRTMQLTFRLTGKGIDRVKAERAAALSVEKYCSVIHTIAPDVKLDYQVEIS